MKDISYPLFVFSRGSRDAQEDGTMEGTMVKKKKKSLSAKGAPSLEDASV